MNERDREVVHVRVVAPPLIVEDIATKIGEFLVAQGYELIEQTTPRPGFHDPREHRIYLTVR